MKVLGDLRPKGLLKGTSKSTINKFHNEIFINTSTGRAETRGYNVYNGHGWTNGGNEWYILGPLNLVEWSE